MKPIHHLPSSALWRLSLSAGVALCIAQVCAHAAPAEDIVSSRKESKHESNPGQPRHEEDKHVVLRLGSEERSLAGENEAKGAWLGIGTEEAPEALSAQLKLEPGVGIVATFVAKGGPAAKAGLQKNDLLIQLDDHKLVHPEQLRRLVQARQPGDEIKLTYLRNGEKQNAAIKLEPARHVMPDFRKDLQLELGRLRQDLTGVPMKDLMVQLEESLGRIKIDQSKVQEQVKKSLAEAKKAMQQALEQADEAGKKHLREAARALDEARSAERRKALVTVKSNTQNVKSVVKSDDSGTIVIVSNPKPRLTVHDPEGKLLFDGPIDTQEQRNKVPREIWSRVEPMLDDSKVLEEE